MSKLFTIISLLILCLTIPNCQACDTVITTLEQPTLISIEIPSEVHGFNGTYYNETTFETVSHFMDNLEPCPWYDDNATNTCSLRARYARLSAAEVGLHIGECTVIDGNSNRVARTLISGHRVNVFMDGDTKYFTTNPRIANNRVVDTSDLLLILHDLFDITSINTINYRW